MLRPVLSTSFRRDVKRAEKRGKELGKLRDAIAFLAKDQKLPLQYKDHLLKGAYAGFRDAHLGPDWLLIYRIVGDELQLARTGSHADLFDG